MEPRKTVLVTGPTGYLGAHTLAQLMQDPTVHACCLVRAADERAAAERLKTSLTQYGLWSAEVAGRVQTLVGDLEAPMVGLSRDDFLFLADNVSAIYHNGANVNYVLPYARLQKANVQGTQELLRMAQRAGARFVYVSTLRVFDSRFDGKPVLEDDAVDEGQTTYSGYSHSKWIGEKLVRAAGARGLDFLVIRPGLVWGGGPGCAANENDAISRLVKGCVELGYAPDSELQVNLTPASYVIDGAVWLSRQPQLRGGTFHLVNDAATQCNKLFRNLVTLGYPIEIVPYRDWLVHLRAAAGTGRATCLMPLLEYLDDDFPARSRRRVFDSRRTSRLLEGAGITCAELNDDYIQATLSGLRGRGFLPEPGQLCGG